MDYFLPFFFFTGGAGVVSITPSVEGGTKSGHEFGHV